MVWCKNLKKKCSRLEVIHSHSNQSTAHSTEDRPSNERVGINNFLADNDTAVDRNHALGVVTLAFQASQISGSSSVTDPFGDTEMEKTDAPPVETIKSEVCQIRVTSSETDSVVVSGPQLGTQKAAGDQVSEPAKRTEQPVPSPVTQTVEEYKNSAIDGAATVRAQRDRSPDRHDNTPSSPEEEAVMVAEVAMLRDTVNLIAQRLYEVTKLSVTTRNSSASVAMVIEEPRKTVEQQQHRMQVLAARLATKPEL